MRERLVFGRVINQPANGDARMTRDPRYDILFEPMTIGPVTAKNRFYQVPHCTGMGYDAPRTLNRMREVNAEGGWGVVCTEFCSIHPSALSNRQVSLWDDDDVRMLSDMTERVHAYGSLAGVELWYGGYSNANILTREVPLGTHSMPVWHGPVQTQAMDRIDIRNLRRWHRDAAIRAKRAGFDIIYVYAAHGYLPSQFLSPIHNQRTDEYGGSFENRARLIRELLEETKDAVGDTCGVAFRFAVDNLDADDGVNYDGEGRDLVELLAELPDLWDVNIADFAADARPSRFAEEGAQEKYIAFVKQVTSKPVVGVGRFTSPDTMVSQINRGILDFIGAARPSIADPFLPKKVEEGRPETIRECIGCNICVWANRYGEPIRCTQNATRGEEWRRDWHPEIVPGRHADENVLVVGAGPAGLEAARVLGERGYTVALAEASTTLGGRVSFESALPTLSEWGRVRDYRVQALSEMTNVEIYRDSHLDAEQILEFGFTHVCIATGSHWRTDGTGRTNHHAFDGWQNNAVHSLEKLNSLEVSAGACLVYDDDNHYMASVVAEKLKLAGHDVVLVSSAAQIAVEGEGALEQHRTQQRMLELGIDLVLSHKLKSFDGNAAEFACCYSGRITKRTCSTLVPVTSRQPDDTLYQSLMDKEERFEAAGIRSVQRIGDCQAPGLIAAAVFAGHRYARELGGNTADAGRDRSVIGELPEQMIRREA